MNHAFTPSPNLEPPDEGVPASPKPVADPAAAFAEMNEAVRKANAALKEQPKPVKSTRAHRTKAAS